MNILVSACLLGTPCRYDGTGKLEPALERLRAQGHTLVPVCPEVLAGAGIPRKCVELRSGRAINADGLDVDDIYRAGAEAALAQLIAFGAECAVLKSRSPTCGVREIYDGTFSGRLISGSGIFAAMVRDAGIRVIDTDEFE